MNKLLAAIVATTFALGSAAGIAADTTAKKEELTKEERADMRARAEKLTAQRAQAPAPATHVAKKHHPAKHKKGTGSEAKKSEPKT